MWSTGVEERSRFRYDGFCEMTACPAAETLAHLTAYIIIAMSAGTESPTYQLVLPISNPTC